MKKQWACCLMVVFLLIFHIFFTLTNNSAFAVESRSSFGISTEIDDSNNDGTVKMIFSIPADKYDECVFDISVKGAMLIRDSGKDTRTIQKTSIVTIGNHATIEVMFVPESSDLPNSPWSVRASAKRNGQLSIPYIYERKMVENSYANGYGKDRYRSGLPVVVSMGDSYAAGQGTPPFYGYSENASGDELINDADWLAHRSELAWSGQLKFKGSKREISYYKDSNWFFTAVSGATTEHIGATDDQERRKGDLKLAGISDSWFKGKNQGMEYSHYDEDYMYRGIAWMPKQIEVFNELKKRGISADYVTLSIGGNDVGFVDDVKMAIIESIAIKINRLNYLNPSMFYTRVLENAPYLQSKIHELLAEFEMPEKGNYKNKLKQAYINIADAAGPQAKILVTGYPTLMDEKIEKVTFPLPNIVDTLIQKDEKQNWIMACNGLGQILFAEGDARVLNNACNEFNWKIQEAINELRDEGINIYFVPIDFTGHEAYTDDPWINPVLFWQMDDDIEAVENNPLSAYSIHPNQKGISTYTRSVQEVVDILQEDAQVSGTVYTNDKNARPGRSEVVEIIFTDSQNEKYHTVTDYEGRYSIQLPRDQFTVEFRRPSTGTAYEIDVQEAFGNKSSSTWLASCNNPNANSYIRYDKEKHLLQMRINCYESCTQNFHTQALPEESLSVPAGPNVSSLDELIGLYLESIKETYEWGKLPGNLSAEKGISTRIGIDALNARRDGGNPYDFLGYGFTMIGEEEVLLIGRSDNDYGPIYDAYRVRDGVPKLILQATNQTKFYLDLTHETVRFEWSLDSEESLVFEDYYWDNELCLHRMEEDSPWELCVPEEVYLIPFSQWISREPLEVVDSPNVSSLDELMALYLQTIQDCYNDEVFYADLPEERGISMMVGEDAINARYDGLDPYEELGYALYEWDNIYTLLIGNTNDMEGLVYDAYIIRNGIPKLILQSKEYDRYYWDGVHGTVRREYSNGANDSGIDEYQWDDNDRLISNEIDPRICFPEEIGYTPFAQWGSEAEAEPALTTSTETGDSYLDATQNLFVGDVVTFGHYEQDNDLSNGPEPIEWIVLENDGETAKLMARDDLDCVPFNDKVADVTWETCTLRQWLNHDFLENAFTEEERSRIVPVELTTGYDGEDAAVLQAEHPQNKTTDSVFILSWDEFERYQSSFPEMSEKRLTPYTKENTDADRTISLYGLRSMSGPQVNSVVGSSGQLMRYSVYNSDMYVVSLRPMICLRIEYLESSAQGSHSDANSEQSPSFDKYFDEFGQEFIGPDVSSVDELMALYLQEIQQCYGGEYPEEFVVSDLVYETALYAFEEGEDPYEKLGYAFISSDEESLLFIGRTYDENAGGWNDVVYDAYLIRNGVPRLILQSIARGTYCVDLRHNTVQLSYSNSAFDGGVLESCWDNNYHLIPINEDEPRICNPERIDYIPFSQWCSDNTYESSVEKKQADRDSEDHAFGNDYLMPVLENVVPNRIIRAFEQADYDGDGTQEAFGLALEYEDDFVSSPAELWFVKGSRAIRCESDCWYGISASCLEKKDGETLYKVVEGYGGSGESIRYWSCKNGEPYLYHGDYEMVGRSVLNSEDWVETGIVVDKTVDGTATSDPQLDRSEVYITELYIDQTVGEADGASLVLPGNLTVHWESSRPVEAYSLVISDADGNILTQDENYAYTSATLDSQNLQLFETYRFAIRPSANAAGTSGQEILFSIVDEAYLSSADQISTPTMAIEPSWDENDLCIVHPGDVTLRWHADGPVDHYTLKITDGNSENDISQDFTTEETPLVIPEVDVPQDYLITVTAVPRGSLSESTSSSLTVRAVPVGYVDIADDSPDLQDRARQELTDLGLLPENASEEKTREIILSFQKWVNSVLDQEVLTADGKADETTLFYIDYCVDNEVVPVFEVADTDQYDKTPPIYGEGINPTEAGSTGEDILRIQNMLVMIGYMTEDQSTGIYSEATMAAVRTFQEWVNSQLEQEVLPVNGIADELTLQYLEYCVNIDTNPDRPENSDDNNAYSGGKIYTEVSPQDSTDHSISGDIGPDPVSIRALQEMLMKVNVMTESDISGTYDTVTAACVGAFQWWANANGLASLRVTGIVDDDTRKALEYCVDHNISMQWGT